MNRFSYWSALVCWLSICAGCQQNDVVICSPAPIGAATVATTRAPSVGFPHSGQWLARADVSLRLSVDRACYMLNEPIRLRAQLKNESSIALQFSGLSLGVYGNAVSIVGPSAVTYEGPFKSTPGPKPFTLQPGQIHEEITDITPEHWDGLDASGQYTISYSYQSGGQDGFWEGTFNDVRVTLHRNPTGSMPNDKPAVGKAGWDGTTPAEVERQQFSEWAQKAGFVRNGQRYTDYEITYQGSDEQFHYFCNPEPYYRIRRDQLPELKTAEGVVFQCAKDEPESYFTVESNLTLTQGPPLEFHRKMSPQQFAEMGIQVKIQKQADSEMLRLTIHAPGVHDSEELSECHLLHPAFAPLATAGSITHPLSETPIELTAQISAVDVQRARIAITYSLPGGGTTYIIPLSEIDVEL